MTLRYSNKTLAGIAAVSAAVSCTGEKHAPNILICVADDATFEHWGAIGCSWVNTPAFDRVASQGVLYTNCYTPNAKSAPSRACMLTGKYSWQLGEAANHICNFPEDQKVFTEVLSENGYEVGYTCKGWGPGNPGKVNGRKRLLTGKAYDKRKAEKPTAQINPNDYAANFKDFLDNVGDGPWLFWYGSREPHRKYEYGSGVSKGGKTLDMIDRVPGFLPDCDSVRNDLLDYAFEIEHFDDHLGRMLAELEVRGMLHNTLVIVTADNGMPFPRCKGNNYEYSHHLPLAVMWPDGIRKPGRIENGFVSFVDIAPTLFDIAGINPEASGMGDMPGVSFRKNLVGRSSGTGRKTLLFGRERDDNGRPGNQGYPIRAIREGDWLYLWNVKPWLMPAGNPETGYRDMDSSPSKTVILNMMRSGLDSSYWKMSMGLRPEVELYNVASDPYCLENLATTAEGCKVAGYLREKLEQELVLQGDPRMGDDGDVFDRYPFDVPSKAGIWEDVVSGRIPEPWNHSNWVIRSDYPPYSGSF
ncbi:MAG: sulfatase [Candidatus Cryptobacteroides sp.]